ncbi:thiosulfate oxidation carrier complex protein SoxZ [Hyphomicrobium methylovorum]|uniref:thiosulfate oxidation carrier complex protein SoxZ n=1 Tax=Hyphomicrobium methylovorum TaxID=84 RepID=UPI0015E6FA20|nr:thiosulfate oxidation carrier complex protein SoxZ [Hyphomicrobium methylovorum]MBA2127456.1 thiosulfate oxidation carrier complex protein SoxZ [Hyphomicrobium methylovorum]
MATPKPRVKVQKTATAGEVVIVKTLISHDMESGQRKDKDGKLIPRHIINKFIAEFNGQQVFSCDVHPAVSSNPYFEFGVKVSQSGTFKFIWMDDDGSSYSDEQKIEVK